MAPPPKSQKDAKQKASKTSNKAQKRKFSSKNHKNQSEKKSFRENLNQKSGKTKSKQASKVDHDDIEQEEEQGEEITKEIEELDFNDALSAGLAFEQLNAYEGAIEAFEVALKYEPDNLTVLSHLADAYMANEQVHKAIEIFLQATRSSKEQEEQDPSLWFRLAMAYESIEKFDPAIESYQKSLQVLEELSDQEESTTTDIDTQTYSITLAALANCFGSKSDLEGAIQVYREATHKYPTNGKYHYNLATMLSMSLSTTEDTSTSTSTRKQIETIKKAYEKAIEFCPEEKEFYQDFMDFLQHYE